MKSVKLPELRALDNVRSGNFADLIGEDGVLNLEALKDTRSPYSPEQKLKAVLVYATTGSCIETSRRCNIPVGTLQDWRANSWWWPKVINYARKTKSDELDGAMTGIIHETLEHIRDRLVNGDYKLVNGEMHRVPVPARELAALLGILWDKRNMQRGEFLTMSNTNESVNSNLVILQKKFEEFANTQGKVQGSELTITSHEIITDA